VYVGGAVVLSTQGSHRPGTSPDLPTTGVGGTAIGVTGEAGVVVASHFAFGIEASLPSRFTSVQETDYSRVFQQESRHRDAAISGLFRATLGSPNRMRLGIVGGGGFVQESTLQRRRDQVGYLPSYPPVFGPYSKEYAFARWTVAALAGADVELAIRPHLSLVPQIRVHVVRRPDDPSAQPGWAMGLSSVVLRPSLGIRAAF
jgi:hypothetical protein